MGHAGDAADDEMRARLERFEGVLADVQEERAFLDGEIDRLKREGKTKTKTVTFKQHMGRRMMLNSLLAIFEEHGL